MIGIKFAELYVLCMSDSTTPLEVMEAAYDEIDSACRDRDALRAERDALFAELTEARTLRPAKCRPECYQAGWNAAQEAAARVASSHIIVGHSIQEPSIIAVIKQIRALVPPADCCGACNPLAPDAQ